MTAEDSRELARIQEQAHRELDICQQYVEQLKLSMQLVDVEHIFGGERVVIYYLAESRVDFRELVKLLAGEFQTRIEMRQIGVRDEAKLLADYGDCGIPVCCNTHLVVMPPVSMKMAKLQKATLDPTKISGRCGRLKCCLRYEYETYEQAQREPPAAAPGERGGPRRGLPPDAEELPRRRGRSPPERRPCLTPRLPACWKKIAAIRWRPTSSSSRPSTMRRTCWGWGGSARASRSPRRSRARCSAARAGRDGRPGRRLPYYGYGGKGFTKEERHVTGQELCEAVRRFALEQYGYMAKTVLANWGIHATADVGELVFNLIRIRQMRKTPHDRREDFHEVYDFQTAFQQDFRFAPSEPPPPEP